MILGAVYMLYAYQRVMLGGQKAVFEKVTDVNTLDYFILIPLLVLIIGLGIYPQPVFDLFKIAGSALGMAH
jgi:NADH-quinone oxidoreductase subunit M